MKSKRRALKTILQDKIVNISDFRTIRNGKSQRRVAIVTDNTELYHGLAELLKDSSEVIQFDGRFSLEQGLKNGEVDGILLDERLLRDDAMSLCEKIKKTSRSEDLFVVILSGHQEKDIVRQGYERGCDEWITRLDDYPHLAKLIAHHLDR